MSVRRSVPLAVVTSKLIAGCSSKDRAVLKRSSLALMDVIAEALRAHRTKVRIAGLSLRRDVLHDVWCEAFALAQAHPRASPNAFRRRIFRLIEASILRLRGQPASRPTHSLDEIAADLILPARVADPSEALEREELVQLVLLVLRLVLRRSNERLPKSGRGRSRGSSFVPTGDSVDFRRDWRRMGALKKAIHEVARDLRREWARPGSSAREICDRLEAISTPFGPRRKDFSRLVRCLSEVLAEMHSRLAQAEKRLPSKP